jgi:hypothetical protein
MTHYTAARGIIMNDKYDNHTPEDAARGITRKQKIEPANTQKTNSRALFLKEWMKRPNWGFAMKKFAFALFLFLSSYGFTESLEYVVERKGKEIGTHSFIFSQSDGGMKVQISTNIVVKLGFIPVYKFIHDGLETWTNGVLIGYDSTTNDNGADKFLKFYGNSIHSSRGDFPTLGNTYIPTSLWSISTIKATELLSTLDGRPMKVSFQALGEEDILTKSRKKLRARHFSMKGDLERELWYDNKDRLVQVKFKGGDGSTINYILDE